MDTTTPVFRKPHTIEKPVPFADSPVPLAGLEGKSLGSLSYKPRGNLSVFTKAIIYAIACYIKKILGLER
jgi:hypothetical protein